MRLKSLEMQGFKSFPDKIKLNFDDGITAVVGPNGSGKSNISDAVRWVLGEQSAKTLRGGKMEDVIFNGTKARKAQSFAEVTLSIDNSSRSAAIDSDEILVTRKYFRSGESEYRINGNAVRLRDIHELFMDTGLGRDGYSLIGQGRIAEIIGAKSNERREIFEEASGISKYRYRKEESERKLAQAEDNLLRLRDILVELEGRVAPLKEQSEKAQKFIALSAEKRKLEISLWVNRLGKIKNELRAHENKITAVKTEYELLAEELKNIDKAVEDVFENAQRLGGEIESLRREISEKEENISASKSRRAVTENDILHLEEEIERINQSLLAEGDLSGKTEEEISRKKEQLSSLLAKEAELLGEEEKNNAALAELDSRGGSVSEKEDNLSKIISEASIGISDKTIAIATAEAAINNLSERESAIKENLKAKKEAEEGVLEEEKNCKELLDALSEKTGEFENAKKGVLSLYDMRKAKLDKYLSEQGAFIKEAEEKLSRAAILSDLEKNMEGFGFSVKATMKRAKDGGLRGIHGPVSKLISVPSKYAAAIETALGAAMQNIVVENEEAAKAAISFLKQTNQGRATFLPITSLKPSVLSENGLDDAAGYINTAAELVEYDKKYDTVIKYLLGRVAVAEDLDSAAYIAKKYSYRFKTVTLDGQVINAGGSFTGGSLSRSSGILSRAGEIERLKNEAEELKKKADGFNEDIESLKEEMSGLEAKKLAIDSEQQTFIEDTIRYEAEHKRLSGILEEISIAKDEAESELQKIKTAKELHNLSLNENKKEIDRLKEERETAEKELEGVSDNKDSLSAEREAITEKIVNGKMMLLEVRKDIENINAAVDSLNEQKQQHMGKNEDLISRKTQAENLISLKREEISLMEKETEDSRLEITSLKEKVMILTEERNGAEKRISEIRSGEREKSDRKEALSAEIARMEERRITKQADYDSIISKLWNEYELTRNDAITEAGELEDVAAAGKSLADIKNKIRGLGNVNLGAMEEYKEVSERYEFLKKQVDDVERSKEELLKLISELTRDMSRIFLENFEKINSHFGRIFSELFGGGTATLELSDRNDVLSCGIDIIAQPPGKIIKNLSALSGGEQALVAIAIYFSILMVKPSPFCILDEIEAALDDVNVTRYAQYLGRMCQKTQFIAITHRRGTMEEADVLYGVTMEEEGVSKLLRLNVSEIEQKMGIKEN
ncbi:MAG: chromosome segregation protein SMC [Oscillospiraceae bacterium]|nr:chromosome segregation protein SMC [Oscillospiraceae bacterium]